MAASGRIAAATRQITLSTLSMSTAGKSGVHIPNGTSIHTSSSSSSSSFYLPHNTTVCTSTPIQFLNSRTARSDKSTNSCPKTFNETVTGYIFHHASKMLQTKKNTRKINHPFCKAHHTTFPIQPTTPTSSKNAPYTENPGPI